MVHPASPGSNPGLSAKFMSKPHTPSPAVVVERAAGCVIASRNALGDMWQPQIGVICVHLPDTVLVLDKFHITQQLLKVVDEIRRAEAAQLKKTNPELLTRTRCLWQNVILCVESFRGQITCLPATGP